MLEKALKSKRMLGALTVVLCGVPAAIWASQDESRAPDGSILHRRPVPSGEAAGEAEAPVFVYDPSDRSVLPSDMQREGETLVRPSLSLEPREGEQLHTAAGAKPLETGPDSPVDPSGILPPEAPKDLDAIGGDAVSASADVEGDAGPGEVPGGPDAESATFESGPGEPAMADPRDGLGSEVLPDRDTEKEGTLHYSEVFEPSVVPFKRNRAVGEVGLDYGIRSADEGFEELEVMGTRVEAGREAFWGTLLLEGRGGERIPIPSVSPESRILSYQASPEQRVVFERDSSGNYYLTPEREGRLRVVFLTDAPSRWFGGAIPDGLRFSEVPRGLRPKVPRAVAVEAEVVARFIGVTRAMGLSEALKKLVAYFRGFEPGDPPPSTGSVYRDVALGKKGVCRHRVHGFVITAQTLGIPARYVFNEAHVFAEVYVPGARAGWMRVDLGGGAEALNVYGAERSPRHRPREADPFEKPEEYLAQGLAGATTVHGLPDEGPLADVSENEATGGGRPREARLPIPRARVAPNLKPTRTELKVGESFVFRGEELVVSGQVKAVSGEPVGEGTVQILLVDAQTLEAIAMLGTASLDEAGRYSARVGVPQGQPPGSYEILAEFIGNAVFAGSSGR